MVSTRNSIEKSCRSREQVLFEQLIVRTLNMAASRTDMSIAIRHFTDEIQRKEPFDFLLLHAAAAVSLKEFETCMRLYAVAAP